MIIIILPHYNTITKESNSKVMQFSKEEPATGTGYLNFAFEKNYSADALLVLCLYFSQVLSWFVISSVKI